MAMNLENPGKKKGVTPEMNVTPLVDVVLVLLIIFMVITPLLTKNFWVHTPKQEKEEIEKPEQEDPNPPLVLRITKEQTIDVNGTEVGLDELPERLKRMFAAKDDHILFFDAADEVAYGFAVEVMDKAREGGAVTIAALTTGLGSTGLGAAEPGAEAPPAAN
jgi:biopolymer transport protein ExbD/biopolymer transport protein TolR